MLCVDFPSTFTLLKDKREIGKGNPPAVTAAGQRSLAFPWCSWMSLLFHVKLMLPLSRVTRTTAPTSWEDCPGSTSSWMGGDAVVALLMCVCDPQLIQDCVSLSSMDRLRNKTFYHKIMCNRDGLDHHPPMDENSGIGMDISPQLSIIAGVPPCVWHTAEAGFW